MGEVELKSGPQVVLFGAWYMGDVMAELVSLLRLPFAGFVDPQPAPWNNVIQPLPDQFRAGISIGDPCVRRAVFDRLNASGRELVSLCHPTSVVSPSAQLETGIYLAEQSIVRTAAVLGHGIHLHAGAMISHHCVVEDFVTIGGGAVVASQCKVGAESLIGAGAVLR